MPSTRTQIAQPATAAHTTAPATLRRAAVQDAALHDAPASVRDALRSPGQPLDAKLRADLEPRLGNDFSHVRVHTDSRAAASVRAFDARAYAIGRNIVFGAGHYAPATDRGRRLLAHELTHVAQQGQARGMVSPSTTAHARSEAEARQAARAVLDPTVVGPLPISPAPVAVAPDNGKSRQPFKISDTDMQNLQSTVRQLMDLVDDKTKERILRNDTVAVGLVVDSDGDLTTVYTVAQNRTYPSLRAAADKLGVTRWTATPRAEGRGEVGAPGDAEQLMFEAADANDFRVAGMAVTRSVCADCAEATKSAAKGGVPIAEVHIPLPKAPPAGPKGGGGEGPAGGGAKPKSAPKPTPKGGSAPAEEPHVPAAGGKAPAKIPTTPAVKGGAAPKADLAKGGAKSGARGAGIRSGGGGAAIGGAIALAVIDAAAQIIVQHYVQKILDEKNAEAIEKDLKALEPAIETKAKAQEARLKELTAGDKPVFISVKLRIRWQTDKSGQLGGGTAYMGMDLEDLRADTTKLDKLKREPVQHGLGEAILRDTLGSSEEFWSFSLSYPDLQVVSQADAPAAGGECFIATACYGSANAAQVVYLRAFRDHVLLRHATGHAFVRFYYAVSPPIADALRPRPLARALVRGGLLAPTIALLRGLDAHLGWSLDAYPQPIRPWGATDRWPDLC